MGRMKLAVIGVAAAAVYLGGHPGAFTAGNHAATSSSGPITRNASEALANRMAASGYGWTGRQATCLDDLWTRENSAWDPTQWNLAGSGAYGIPQALPASKMASAGPDWQSNPATQIKWGLGDIASVYGTPCGAWAHETADNWY